MTGATNYRYGVGSLQKITSTSAVPLHIRMSKRVLLGSSHEIMGCGAHGDNLTISAHIKHTQNTSSCSWDQCHAGNDCRVRQPTANRIGHPRKTQQSFLC